MAAPETPQEPNSDLSCCWSFNTEVGVKQDIFETLHTGEGFAEYADLADKVLTFLLFF